MKKTITFTRIYAGSPSTGIDDF